MKLFLLIRTERDDFDVIYGVYSSLANAEIAQRGRENDRDFGSDIKELELDTTYAGGV